MSTKYLDNVGLSHLWGRLKDMLLGKVDKVDGMGLSSNDYTTSEKEKLDDIATITNAEIDSIMD